MFHDTSTSDRLSLSSGSNVVVCCTVRVVVRVRVIVRDIVEELVSSAVIRFEIFIMVQSVSERIEMMINQDVNNEFIRR